MIHWKTQQDKHTAEVEALREYRRILRHRLNISYFWFECILHNADPLLYWGSVYYQFEKGKP